MERLRILRTGLRLDNAGLLYFYNLWGKDLYRTDLRECSPLCDNSEKPWHKCPAECLSRCLYWHDSWSTCKKIILDYKKCSRLAGTLYVYTWDPWPLAHWQWAWILRDWNTRRAGAQSPCLRLSFWEKKWENEHSMLYWLYRTYFEISMAISILLDFSRSRSLRPQRTWPIILCFRLTSML